MKIYKVFFILNKDKSITQFCEIVMAESSIEAATEFKEKQMGLMTNIELFEEIK